MVPVHGACAWGHDPIAGNGERCHFLIKVFDRDGLSRAPAGGGERSCLTVVKPLIGECVAIRVGGAFSAEGDDVAAPGRELGSVTLFHNRRVVGLIVGLGSPINAGGEVVLTGRAPAPDGRVVARVPVAIMAEDFVDSIGPERSGLGFLEKLLHARRVEFVTTTPAAPVGMFRSVQAIDHEAEEAWSIAFHEKFGARVLSSERTFVVADVAVEPVVVHQTGIGTPSSSPVSRYPKPAPRSVVLMILGLCETVPSFAGALGSFSTVFGRSSTSSASRGVEHAANPAIVIRVFVSPCFVAA
jgi:hypothetical protein